MDALVKLYSLPPLPDSEETIASGEVYVRRAMAYEKSQIRDWVAATFTQNWADECEAAFSSQPVSCFVAIFHEQIVGFACYDCTYKNFFGPFGIAEKHRGKGIGKTLLLNSLHSMKSRGYAYAIIGGCDGMETFYINAVNATVIEDSTPGAYPAKLNKPD